MILFKLRLSRARLKHCQRHNGPEGWVHITRSQFTVHKSWTYYNFWILIKHWLQNLNQTSASRLNLKLKSCPNPASEYWPRFNFVTSTKHQQQNTDQTSASKSRLNFKLLTKPCAESLNKSLALWPNLSFQICNKMLPTQFASSTSATVKISTIFELLSSYMSGLHQSSLLNGS